MSALKLAPLALVVFALAACEAGTPLIVAGTISRPTSVINAKGVTVPANGTPALVVPARIAGSPVSELPEPSPVPDLLVASPLPVASTVASTSGSSSGGGSSGGSGGGHSSGGSGGGSSPGPTPTPVSAERGVYSIAGDGTPGVGQDVEDERAGSNLNQFNEGALLNEPRGIAVDPNGIVYFTDTKIGLVRAISLNTFVEVRGGGEPRLDADDCTEEDLTVDPIVEASCPPPHPNDNGTWTGGPHDSNVGATEDGLLTRFAAPIGLARDSRGYLYVADTGNGMVRRIKTDDPDFPVQIIAKTLRGPVGITVDSGTIATSAQHEPTVYFTESSTHKIRKIAPDGSVTDVAGNGRVGMTNANGTSALFNSPSGIAIDASGSLFVSDTGNNLIRKIDKQGNVTTFCGNGNRGLVNGSGSVARFWNPVGLCFDTQGNLYVADDLNNAIRMITPAAVASTIAGGNGSGFKDGKPEEAQFFNPQGVAVDAYGTLFVADTYGHRIRQIVR